MAEERLLWEDLTEGDVAVSSGRTITETDVVNFAGLSGDFNWFHIDDVAAKESVFGQRVAHGMLVASIATGLQVASMEPKVATAAFMGWRRCCAGTIRSAAWSRRRNSFPPWRTPG